MSAATELVPFALLGLAGSLHCAGMCGPLVVSFGFGPSSARAWRHGALYALGKALTYATLSLALASGIAAASAGEPQWLARSRSLFAWIAGGAMVIAALHSFGWTLWPRRWSFTPLQRVIAAMKDAAAELPPPLRAFAFGLANGLLPCGLSWSAIALGAASEPLLAVAGPFVFGLATAPVLLALGIGRDVLPIAWRVRGRGFAATVLLLAGVWTVWRGGIPIGDGAKNVPPCCADEDGVSAAGEMPEVPIKDE